MVALPLENLNPHHQIWSSRRPRARDEPHLMMQHIHHFLRFIHRNGVSLGLYHKFLIFNLFAELQRFCGSFLDRSTRKCCCLSTGSLMELWLFSGVVPLDALKGFVVALQNRRQSISLSPIRWDHLNDILSNQVSNLFTYFSINIASIKQPTSENKSELFKTAF